MKHLILYILLFCSSILTVQGQQDVKVASILHQDVLPYKANTSLVITAEKARIQLLPSSENHVRYEIESFAKHPDETVAKRDVKKHQVLVEKLGKKIYFRNFISLGKSDQKPESNVSTIYKIWVPTSCTVELKTKFCETEIVGFENELIIEENFSNLLLENHVGKATIDSYLGELTLRGTHGQYTLTTKRSKVRLLNNTGDYTVQSKYGDVFIDESDPALYNLDIRGDASNIEYNLFEFLTSQFTIRSESGELMLSEQHKVNITKVGNSKEILFHPAGALSTINIFNTYGKIDIK